MNTRYERVEGWVWCHEHGAVHDDSTDPYDTGSPDCHRVEHRSLYFRWRRDDFVSAQLWKRGGR